MRITGGLSKDGALSNRPNGTFNFARNVLPSKVMHSPVNENGMVECPERDGILMGVVVTDQFDIYFYTQVGNDTTVHDEIRYGSTCPNFLTLKGNFNFSVAHPIEGTFTYNARNELIIVWTDDYNPVRYLNMGCLPFEINNDGTLVNPDQSILLNLFSFFTSPNYSLQAHGNDGQLVTGVYYFSGAYLLSDGGVTNAWALSNPISVNEDDVAEGFDFYDGAEPGTLTGKSINMQLTGIDTNYSKFVILIVKKIGNVITAVKASEYDITGATMNVVYTGGDETDIALEDVLVASAYYDLAKTVTTLDNKLHIGNLRGLPEFDYQTYANYIKIDWVREDDISLTQIANSYKDEIKIFDSKGFQAGEVYAFYIIFRLKAGGGFTQAFHIPGPCHRYVEIDINSVSTALTLQEINDDYSYLIAFLPDFAELLAINPNYKLYEVYNTATFVTPNSGLMGVAINNNEVYPDASCSDVAFNDHPCGTTLRGENVRHHKFPDLYSLQVNGNDFITPDPDNILANDPILTLYPDGATGGDVYFAINSNTSTGDLNFTNTLYTATQQERLHIYADFTIASLGEPHVLLQIIRANGDIEILQKYDGYLFGGSFSVQFDLWVDFQIGDSFELDIDAPSYGSYSPGIFDYIYFVPFNTDRYITNSKILGISVRDVYIPSNLLPYIDGWEICYAKRDNTNNSILGQSLVYLNERKQFKFYDFNMLKYKPNNVPTYMKMELTMSNSNTDYIGSANIVPDLHFRQVIETQYVPYDVATSFIDNVSREEFFGGKFVNEIFSVYEPVTPLFFLNLPLANLIMYRSDYYQNYKNQKLARTGIKISVTDSGIQDTVPKLYGGDIFISAYGALVSEGEDAHNLYWDGEQILPYYAFNYGTSQIYFKYAVPPTDGDYIRYSFSIWFFATESIANLNFRHRDDLDLSTEYFPFTGDIPRVMKTVSIPNDPDPILVEFPYGKQTYLYNNDYSSVNDLNTLIVFACTILCNEYNNDYPFRVATSEPQQMEGDFGWHTFLVNNYYDMPKTKGEVWKLNVYNRVLIIHLEYATFVASIKDIIATNEITAYLGTGELFDRLPDELIPADGGYAGCQSQWATVVCKHGVIWADVDRGRVFLFNGKLVELSNEDMRRFFLENLPFGYKDDDNPFYSTGLTMTYDDDNNRFILGKMARTINETFDEYIPDPAVIFTISYSFDETAWYSFHDYYPSYMWYNRAKVRSVDNIRTTPPTNKSYRHNDPTSKGKFYNGIVYPCYVDVIINPNNEKEFVWSSLYWRTEMENLGITSKYYDKTITQIMIYNIHQCTGLITLANYDALPDNATNRRTAEYKTTFNRLRDKVINRDTYILSPLGELNTSNINVNKLWFKSANLISSVIVVRLQYDNIEQNEIIYKTIEALAQLSNRL